MSSKPHGGRVVARLGRDADLILPGKNISRVHVAFEVHPVSRKILLWVCAERMESVTIKPGGFRKDGDFRQLALEPGTKYDIRIGGSIQPFRFKLQWLQDAPSVRQCVDAGFRTAQTRAMNLRWVKTEDENDSELRSWYNIILPSGAKVSVRAVIQGRKLGAGTFGNVHKATDVDLGHIIAVKVVKPETIRDKAHLHREVKTMQTLKHVSLALFTSPSPTSHLTNLTAKPRIVEFFGQQGWAAKVADIKVVQIFIPLRTGSVCDLAPLPLETENTVIQQLLYQMLCVLDYLSSRSLCHRDVKPGNILYDESDGNYTFQLADFGLVNHETLAETNCGTRIFSAPELHAGHGLDVYRQSPKMDIWSLMVTIISLMTDARFDGTKLARGNYSGIVAFVRNTVPNIIPGIKPMAPREHRIESFCCPNARRTFRR